MAQHIRVVEDGFVGEQVGQRCVGVQCLHVCDVGAEQGAFERCGADEVKRHGEELLAGAPLAHRGDDGGEFGPCERGGVGVQQELQHAHEVRFTGTEAARQKGCFGAVFAHRRADEGCGLAEGRQELVGDDVAGDGLGAVFGGVGEFEHQVALADLGGDGDGVAKQHAVSFQR